MSALLSGLSVPLGPISDDEQSPPAAALKLTPAAAQKFIEVMDAEGFAEHALRVAAVRLTPSRLQYDLAFESLSDRQESDHEVSVGRLTLWVDAQSASLLGGATVDYVDGLDGTGFRFDNPNERKSFDDPTATALQTLFEQEVNPAIAAHGGFVELVDYREQTAYVLMGGGCQGCGMAAMTLREGIETQVRERFPEIQRIVDATDHAAGTNPYA